LCVSMCMESPHYFSPQLVTKRSSICCRSHLSAYTDTRDQPQLLWKMCLCKSSLLLPWNQIDWSSFDLSWKWMYVGILYKMVVVKIGK
jgi:hypothetical protein